ncbi:hypothetical protein GWI33_020767 [Rhynchophorus ferrugineus]|uniref:Transcription factor CBF/NF-Y/archaeal histone domain-containing protein n=1 Tax=Rhynchophorus ferrugineus TaxID=354439 RepID=A0A834HQN4_RHYFE|nr:hypothetical protein GWI33_020767 [Rhynchophorus ferrugineus]
MDAKFTTKPVLPVGRVNTIMKSSSDVETVSKESSVIMSKATELFIRSLTQEGYNETNSGRKLDYKHLSSVVHSNERYNFLRDILPKKITVLEFKKLMAAKQAVERTSDAEETSSDEESSSEGSSVSHSSDELQKNI